MYSSGASREAQGTTLHSPREGDLFSLTCLIVFFCRDCDLMDSLRTDMLHEFLTSFEDLWIPTVVGFVKPISTTIMESSELILFGSFLSLPLVISLFARVTMGVRKERDHS